MPNLYCSCGGDGMIPVTFGNHENHTLHKSMLRCPECNGYENPFSGKKPDEVIIPEKQVQQLLQEGYTLQSH